jgi:hypothetical protein
LKIAIFQNFPHAAHKLSGSVSDLSQFCRLAVAFRAGFAALSRRADPDDGRIHARVS